MKKDNLHILIFLIIIAYIAIKIIQEALKNLFSGLILLVVVTIGIILIHKYWLKETISKFKKK